MASATNPQPVNLVDCGNSRGRVRQATEKISPMGSGKGVGEPSSHPGAANSGCYSIIHSLHQIKLFSRDNVGACSSVWIKYVGMRPFGFSRRRQRDVYITTLALLSPVVSLSPLPRSSMTLKDDASRTEDAACHAVLWKTQHCTRRTGRLILALGFSARLPRPTTSRSGRKHIFHSVPTFP